jgi:hypothetical protein
MLQEHLREFDLRVTDPELLAYIRAVPEDQRQRLILAALRIGFTTLSEVRPQVDQRTLMDVSEHIASSLRQQGSWFEQRLQSWSDEQGPLEKAMIRASASLSQVLDQTHPESPANRLLQQIRQELAGVESQWSLDNEDSAFSRLGKLLQNHRDTVKQDVELVFQELKTLQLEQQIRKDESLKGTRHGAVFEEALVDQITRICAPAGHIVEPTGEVPGMIKACKVGDLVVTLSPEHAAAGANLVIEAKQSKSYTLKKALEEIEVGRKNRSAEVGIFVMSRSRAPESWPWFQRFDQDLVIIWDAEDPTTDIYLEAGLSVATALCSRRRYQAEDLPDFIPMQQAVIDLEKQLQGCDEITRLASTIYSNAEKITKRADLMQSEATVKIADLHRCLDQLRRLDIAVID